MSYITKFLLAFFLLHWPVYLNGNEGRKWIEEDLKALERSAQEGDSYAQGFLALCYVHGDKGLDISFDKASYWANLSMETNHWLGLFTMGYLNRFPPIGRWRILLWLAIPVAVVWKAVIRCVPGPPRNLKKAPALSDAGWIYYAPVMTASKACRHRTNSSPR